jgi:hypothetical protein
MDQDKILEQKIRQISEQVYAEKTLKSKYGVSQVPFHTHNGIDSTRIDEKNVLHNIRNYTRLMADESTVFNIRSVSNVDKLTLKGFVANNADGSPATKRAIINGEAYFGRCYNFTGVAPNISTSPVQGIPFVQSSNALYTEQGMSAVFRVAVSPSLAFVTDGSSDIVELLITSYNNGLIEFDLQMQAGQNWLLQVDLILS